MDCCCLSSTGLNDIETSMDNMYWATWTWSVLVEGARARKDSLQPDWQGSGAVWDMG